jgi:hypothetical protein
VALCALGFVVFAVGLAIYVSDGAEYRAINSDRRGYSRFIAQSRTLDSRLRAMYGRKVSDCRDLAIDASAARYCTSYGTSADVAGTVVLWGDSHAGAWAPVFYRIADEQHLRVIAFIHLSCPPLVGVHRSDPAAESAGCGSVDIGDQFATAIKAIGPSRIFLIARWSIYTRGWTFEGQLQPITHFITTDPLSAADEASSALAMQSQLLKTLEALPDGTPVTVFKTMPVLYSYVDRGLLRQLPLDPTAHEHEELESVPNLAIDTASSTLPNVTVFDPGALSCQYRCSSVLDGTLLYSDDNHVSAQGALMFKNSLQQDYFAVSVQRPR